MKTDEEDDVSPAGFLRPEERTKVQTKYRKYKRKKLGGRYYEKQLKKRR